MNDVTDHYGILGLEPGVPIREVKARFRQLAMDVHPDRNENDPSCQERLKRINAAYDFLSDSSRKAAYDVRFRLQTAPTFVPRSMASPPPATSPEHGPSHMLVLMAFCVFLVSLVVLLIFGGFSDPSGIAAPPPSVTVIALPPNAAPSNSGADLPAPPSNASMADDGAAMPMSEKSLWPAAPSEQPPSSPDSNGVSPPSNPASVEWPSSDTGSFPSH